MHIHILDLNISYINLFTIRIPNDGVNIFNLTSNDQNTNSLIFFSFNYSIEFDPNDHFILE